MTKPLVSTITPCYNMGKYLKQFLYELPQQKYFDHLEIILDHNAPNADEIKWVKDFQREYPDHLKHIIIPDVDPIGISMNRCIKESSGDFLCIWNIDDLRTPLSIESQVQTLQNDKSVDVVYGNYEVVNSFPKKNGRFVDHSKFAESEITRSMIFGPFFMFRKTLLSQTGIFDEQFKSGCDFDLAIRLGFNGKAKMVRESLGYYLDEGLGASTRKDSLQPIERTAIELRYGIYDKIDYQYLPKALKYNIYQMKVDGAWMDISDFIPNYEMVMNQRYENLFNLGLIRQNKGRNLPIVDKIKKIIMPRS